jgi:hypothetical protein
MYRVDWLQSVVDELAKSWLQADSAQRKAITAASHKIDKGLQQDPLNVGESRAGGRRIEFFAPLAVTFEVDDEAKTVTILHVRVYGKRPK